MKARKLLLGIVFMAALFMTGSHINVAATAVHGTDVTTPASGNVFVGAKGKYENVASSKILNRVNAIRKEAYNEGIVSKYVPIKWSADLEWMSQIRAAEASMFTSHTRPNGTSCFSISHHNVSSYGECLAWNWSGLMKGIEQWYEEKSDYVNKTGYETGHYLALINPSYEYIGVGSFINEGGSWVAVAAEFSYGGKSLNTGRSGKSGSCIQKVEVPKKSVGKMTLKGSHSLSVNQTTTLTMSSSVTIGSDTTYTVPIGTVSYKSSNPKVATVNSSGKITAKKLGKAVITATSSSGTSNFTVNVTGPAKGTKLKKGKFTYRVTKVGKEVEVYKYNKKNAAAYIPSAVTINGIKYKVTRIASKAFYGKKTLTKVVIPESIVYIGKKAFAYCKKLKRIEINTKKLLASRVGSKAFKGIYKKAVFKVPAPCLKPYKKILRKKGAGKKNKFKK